MIDSYWALISLVVGVPTIGAVAAYVWLDRSRTGWITETITIRSGVARLSAISLKPKDVLKTVVVAMPFFVFGDAVGFVSFAGWLVLVLAGIAILGPGFKPEPASPNQLIDDLKGLTHKAEQASDLLKSLTEVLETKQDEVAEIERLKDELAAVVEKRKADAELWATISAESKADFLAAMRRDAARGRVWRSIGGVIAAIVLNLCATAIWVMAGNPGQQQIYGILTEARTLLVQPEG